MRTISRWSALLVGAGVFVASAAHAQLAVNATFGQPSHLTGAIFTTDRNGTRVNGNIYGDCCDVFLNGGPPPHAPCSSAGLPEGDYYFMVTDPSGACLLYTSAAADERSSVDLAGRRIMK